MTEKGLSKTGIASLQLLSMSALGPTGERQEHLDAIVSFAGAGQRRRLFWGLDLFTIRVGHGRFAGRMPLPAQHAADVPEDRRRPDHEAGRR